MEDSRGVLLSLTTDIVASFLSTNTVAVPAIPDLIRSVHGALQAVERANREGDAPKMAQKPAVAVGRSIQTEYLVCLEDGAKLKTLKRYLRARFDLSPEDYRTKWGLPGDYPMVAPAYRERRSEMAKIAGLGKRAE